MGLFDFFGDVAGAVIKVAASPIAVVKDVAAVATGGNANNTKNLVADIGEDLADAVDEITPDF